MKNSIFSQKKMSKFNSSKSVIFVLIFLGFLSFSSIYGESVVVYSAQGEERAEWITEQAKANGHEIQMLTGGGGAALYDRLLAEKANPQADVVLGLVDISMELLKKEGLFQPYVPTWAKGLPDVYKGQDKMIHKFWQTPVVLAYNTDRLSAKDAPKSWLDLIKPKYKDKYVIGSAAWQTTKVYLVGILARFTDKNGNVSDKGWDFMQQFFDNGIVVDSAETKNKLFVNGKAVIDLNWFGGARRQAKNVGYTAKMINTEGGTPFVAEGIALMKGTKKAKESKAFIDWFGSPKFMIAYAKKFGQVPAHPDAIKGSPASIRKDAKLLTPQKIDWASIAPKVNEWMQRIELEIK